MCHVILLGLLALSLGACLGFFLGKLLLTDSGDDFKP